MHIYIDESGIFSNPNNHNAVVSCVGSLVFPDRRHEHVIKKFKNLKREWGIDQEDELKGKQITERQFAEIIHILADNYAMFTAVAIDNSYQEESQLIKHKLQQKEQIELCSQKKMTIGFSKEIPELCSILEKMSSQLYVQFVCMKELISNTFRNSTFYYSKESPETLCNFNWIIDFKNKEITKYELLLSKVIAIFLQEESMTTPLEERKDGNYKAFHKYYCSPSAADENNFNCDDVYVDIGAIIRKNLYFKDSKRDLGLQLVDILTSCLRRSLRGNFQYEGWKYFPKVLFKNIKTKNGIHFITLTNQPTGFKPYYQCLDYLNDNARSFY